MKRFTITFLLNILFLVLIVDVSLCQNNLKIWKEFVNTLKSGDFPPDKIRSYEESLKEPVLGFLKIMQKKANWQEFESEPEVHLVEKQIHYLIPLTFDGGQATYCFSFLVDNNDWYFQHLEAITIRLDKISSLPTSEFPDLPEEQKAWMREEIRVSKQVRLFNLLVEEKGKEFAFNWFKDGYGYLVAARSWVPFFPSAKAFILYVCWEQSRLRGEQVTLETLDENEAVVRLTPIYFTLYQRAAHLKQQISFEDYQILFETIWQDRAEKAGWSLQINYEEVENVFYFKKM
ncbi:MAG: hypothetical protein JSW07_20015 [bacterium]|nr:MAG: hypothetical protein JSW07_20015 [bacterium]